MDDIGSTIEWFSTDNGVSDFDHVYQTGDPTTQTAAPVYAETPMAPYFYGETEQPEPMAIWFFVYITHVDLDALSPCGGSGDDATEATTGVGVPITDPGATLPESFPASTTTGIDLPLSVNTGHGGTLTFNLTGDGAAIYRQDAATGDWYKLATGTGGTQISLQSTAGVPFFENFKVHTNDLFTGPVTIKASVAHDNGEYGGVPEDSLAAADEVKLVPGCVDLDIDSDNTNGFGPPDRNKTEEDIEDVTGDPSKPGKIVVANLDDKDGDGIPDFADGYNLDGTAGNADDTPPTSEKFVALVLQLRGTVDLTTATLKFTYSASDPAGVTTTGTAPDITYTPASGHLRIWTKDASTARKKNSFAAATDAGDFVPSGVTFTPANLTALGFSATNRTVSLYVEGITVSPAVADQRIEIEVDPDGGGQLQAVQDAVRITVVRVDLFAHRAGEYQGQVIPEQIENKHDPKDFVLLTNNDRDEANAEGLKDYENATAVIGGDDDLARIVLRAVGPPLQTGTLRIVLSDPAAVRLFTAAGTELTDLSVDLSNPTGMLAPLAAGDMEIYVEGLKVDPNFVLTLVLEEPGGQSLGSDEIHVLIAEYKLVDRNGEEFGDLVTCVPRQNLLDLANGVPDTEEIPPEAEYRIRLTGLPLNETDVEVRSNTAPADFYNDELLEGAGFLQSKDIAVVYTDAVMTASEKALVKDQLAFNTVYDDGAKPRIKTRRDKYTKVLWASKIRWGFLDKVPSYSDPKADFEGTVPSDSDNYFLRRQHVGYDSTGKKTTTNDYDNLDILYYVKPGAGETIEKVTFWFYGRSELPIGSSDTSFGDTVDGEKDSEGNYKTGDNLHVKWKAYVDSSAIAAAPEQFLYYRVQMVVKVSRMVAGVKHYHNLKSPIDDVDAKMSGWQCGRRTLAVHDLVWKHRPFVHAGTATKDRPYTPDYFRENSTERAKGAAFEKRSPSDEDLRNDHVDPDEHYLDRLHDEKISTGAPPGDSSVMYTANNEAHSNFAFLQYWFFYDASDSASNVSGTPSPYHEGDVEHVQVAIRLKASASDWAVGTVYKKGDIVADKGDFYFARTGHTATAENRNDVTTYWFYTGVSEKEYKWLWFLPYSATASQHFYAQTLVWDQYRTTEASSAQTQTWVQHVENAHFKVYVAVENGTHATYFRKGTFNVKDTLSEDHVDTRLGTQIQYTEPAGSAYETTASDETKIAHWIRPPRAFREWFGRWGYKDSDKGAAFSLFHRDGPPGLALRHAVSKTGDPVYLHTKPLTLHNAALRTGDDFLKIE